MQNNRPTKKMINRIFIILLVLVLVTVSVCSLSLVNIMIFHGEEYQSKATEQQLYDTRITAERGTIYDRNGEILATSAPVWTVFVTPNAVAKIDDSNKREQIKNKICEGLSSILEIEKSEIEEKLGKTKTYYVAIKQKVENDVAQKIRTFLTDNKDLSLSAYIGLDQTTKRYYTNDNLASTVLGFVGNDNQGLSGIELKYDDQLTGTPGRIVAAKNALGTDMPFTYEKKIDAKAGNSVYLTIDEYIQYVTEKYLEDAVESNKVGERGAALVMNVKTAEILAMAVKGDFNPNEYLKLSKQDQATVDAITDTTEKSKKLKELQNKQWRNKNISDPYEPGSVFKVITESIGIEEGFVNLNSSFNCTGTIFVAGQKYNCHKKGGHGVQNLTQATQNSCNPFFISLGQTIGVSTFSKYFNAFGLNEKTGIDLPGEATSQYHSESKMGPTELASSSFGQTFKITPIQLITALAATVNGGKLLTPHIVKKIVDTDGNVIKNYDTTVKRQVISKQTSDTVCQILESVVDGGGGKNAYAAGYRIGGKTGTSQKVAEMLASGKSGLYVASFVGFAPMDDPEIAVLVLLDEPHGSNYYGGTISAPVGGQILSEVLPYLGVEPQYTAEQSKYLQVSVPDVKGKTLSQAKSELSALSLGYRVVGKGDTIVKQLPASTQTIYKNGIVILYTDKDEEIQKALVPNLKGMSISEVNSTAVSAGFNVTFKGNIKTSSGVVSYMQSVEPGTELDKGSVIEVYFRSQETGDISLVD